MGSSHLVLAITPPAWPCLYLKVHQELLTQTSFLFDSEKDEQGWLELEEACGVQIEDRQKEVGREREAERGRSVDRSEYNGNES